MKFMRFLLGLCCLALLAGSPGMLHAEGIATSQCLEQTYAELAHAERQLHSVIIGQKKAQDSPVGAVRFDTLRIGWAKTAPDTWRTMEHGQTATILNDADVDARAEFAPRTGLLEQQKAMTSQDIVPALLQAFRAFQCQTRAICETNSLSAQASSATVFVQIPGCIAYNMPRMDKCNLEQATSSAPSDRVTYDETRPGVCKEVRDELVEHERQILLMLATYDASYRTLLQIGGMFQDVLASFRTSLLTPLWQTVRIMDRFGSVSCFNGQCDE